MKPSYKIIVVAAILLLFIKCNRASDTQSHLICTNPATLKMPEGYNREQKYTLVFLDYTDRRIMGEKTMQMVKDEIGKLLVTPKDRVDVYLITSNTATEGSKPFESYVLDIKPRAELITDATLDSAKKSRIYACQRLQAIDVIQKKFLVKVQEELADSIPYRNSDIAGLFYIANREFARCGNNIVKRLYIVSDLEQNCAGFFKLNNTKFSSLTGVSTGDAANDFSIISETVNVNHFKNVIVKYERGDIPVSTDNNTVANEVLQYWEKLFGFFGIKLNQAL